LGLIGAWKPSEELEQLAWTVAKRPRMIAVQAKGASRSCRLRGRNPRVPPVRERPHAGGWPARARALRRFALLGILRESGGAAVAVSDREIVDAGLELARARRNLRRAEGAAAIAALPKLLADGRLKRDERIVICNTAPG